MATPLTAAVLAAFNTTLLTNFNKGLGQQNQDWTKIAKEIPSSAKANTYAWLSHFPAFREWIGSRLHKRLQELAHQVTNRKFETTLDVDVDDFEDNNLGQYSGVTEGYGEAIGDLKTELVFEGVKGGLTQTCYDGQYFFDADHPVYPNEDGTGVAETVSNLQAGTDDLWILLCTKRAPKAFYLQNRTGTPSLVAKTKLDSENVFEHDVFTWGAKWRGNFAFGFWQLAFGSKAALDAANFDAAVNSMMGVKRDGGKQLNIVPDTIIVGRSNRVAARALFETETLPNGGKNPHFGEVQVIVNAMMD